MSSVFNSVIYFFNLLYPNVSSQSLSTILSFSFLFNTSKFFFSNNLINFLLIFLIHVELIQISLLLSKSLISLFFVNWRYKPTNLELYGIIVKSISGLISFTVFLHLLIVLFTSFSSNHLYD